MVVRLHRSQFDRGVCKPWSEGLSKNEDPRGYLLFGQATFYACARSGILRSTTTHKSSPNRPAPSFVIRFFSCSAESNRRRQTAWRLPASIIVSISSRDTDPNSEQRVRSADCRLPTSPHCVNSLNALFMTLTPPISAGHPALTQGTAICDRHCNRLVRRAMRGPSRAEPAAPWIC